MGLNLLRGLIANEQASVKSLRTQNILFGNDTDLNLYLDRAISNLESAGNRINDIIEDNRDYDENNHPEDKSIR